MKLLTHSFSFVFDSLFFEFSLNDNYLMHQQYSSIQQKYLQSKNIIFDVSVKLIASSQVLEFKLNIQLKKHQVELKFFKKSIKLS